MKLKELEMLMQDVAPFEKPKVELEQYPTGAHLASRLLFAVASSYGEFEGRTCIDLGCGTAMLSIGAAMLGAAHVVGVDVDGDALATALSNVGEYEDHLPIDFVQCDVQNVAAQTRLRADTVVMNPPFGTRRKGADMEFLRAAFRLSTHTVYSLHKSSTRAHIARVAEKELRAGAAEVIAQLRYDLPATYAFHKERSRDIEVDLWRFEVPQQAQQARQQQAAQQQQRRRPSGRQPEAEEGGSAAELGSGGSSSSDSEIDQ